jgi:integrase
MSGAPGGTPPTGSSLSRSAALNFAQRHGHGRGVTWTEVRPFQNASQARARFLSVEEQQRLANGCPPGFRSLVQGALSTGGRYGELAKVLVRDFNAQAGTLFIQFGKAKGGGCKPRHVALQERKEPVIWRSQNHYG